MPGKHDVRVDFADDGGDPGSGGMATIVVDNTQVAQGRIEPSQHLRAPDPMAVENQRAGES